jgi:tRNA(adenine34) deaminase
MAFSQAERAAEVGEVPIGAVIIKNYELIGKAHNQVELLKDPTAHAEMISITQAATALENWRLEGSTLYVTKEPCPMCAGAIVQARIDRVVWGATDPQRGGAISLFNILQNDALNHHVEVQTGVMEFECAGILKSFFKEKRLQNANKAKIAPDDPCC